MKILIVSSGVINNNNGLGRVHYELKMQYERAGHKVDKIDYTDFYPKGQNHYGKIFGKSISRKIVEFLRENAFHYDVIDANLEDIIYPKEYYGFKGVLFLRSHGLRPLGENAEKIDYISKIIKDNRESKSFKTHIGSALRAFYKKPTIKHFYLSIKYGDLFHCLNEAEYNFLINLGIARDRIVFIPNGIPAKTLNELELSSKNRSCNPKIVSFLAAWRIMKGIKDWRGISTSLIQIKDFNKILLLGTSWPKSLVIKDFDVEALRFIEVVTTFKPHELPELLEDVKVGIFTSYTEGFCFALIEQLAAGIPVVAYNIQGVEDVLKEVDPTLLIDRGNIQLLVKKAKFILDMDNEEYKKLSQRCIQISKRYALENLVPLYLESFEKIISKAHV